MAALHKILFLLALTIVAPNQSIDFMYGNEDNIKGTTIHSKNYTKELSSSTFFTNEYEVTNKTENRSGYKPITTDGVNTLLIALSLLFLLLLCLTCITRIVFKCILETEDLSENSMESLCVPLLRDQCGVAQEEVLRTKSKDSWWRSRSRTFEEEILHLEERMEKGHIGNDSLWIFVDVVKDGDSTPQIGYPPNTQESNNFNKQNQEENAESKQDFSSQEITRIGLPPRYPKHSKHPKRSSQMANQNQDQDVQSGFGKSQDEKTVSTEQLLSSASALLESHSSRTALGDTNESTEPSVLLATVRHVSPTPTSDNESKGSRGSVSEDDTTLDTNQVEIIKSSSTPESTMSYQSEISFNTSAESVAQYRVGQKKFIIASTLPSYVSRPQYASRKIELFDPDAYPLSAHIRPHTRLIRPENLDPTPPNPPVFQRWVSDSHASNPNREQPKTLSSPSTPTKSLSPGPEF